MRFAHGAGDGPALMFNSIKDFGASGRSRRLFGRGYRATGTQARIVAATSGKSH